MLGTVMRTDPARKKYLKEVSRKVDAWGDRGSLLDEIIVNVRLEGVDGARLVRRENKEGGSEIEKIKVDDGESWYRK